jgi:DNA repair protein RecO (recombination protein O)
MIRTTEGIILTSMKYGDTSRIVSAYTRDFGKVSLIAKGARGKSSRFGAALEPLAYGQYVFYHKDSRELQLLSQAELLAQFRGMTDDPARCMLGFLAIEYVNRAVHPEDPQRRLFELLLATLRRLDAAAERAENIALRFLLDFCALLGFGISFDACSSCRRPLRERPRRPGILVFDTLSGGFACADCAEAVPGRPVEPALFAALQWIDSAEEDALTRVAFTRSDLDQAMRILHTHAASHIQDLREMRSWSLYKTFA